MGSSSALRSIPSYIAVYSSWPQLGNSFLTRTQEASGNQGSGEGEVSKPSVLDSALMQKKNNCKFSIIINNKNSTSLSVLY